MYFFGNSVESWITAGAIFAVALISFWIVKKTLGLRLAMIAEKKPTQADQIALLLVQKTHLFFILSIALFFALHTLNFPVRLETFLQRIIVLFVFIQIGNWAAATMGFLMDNYVKNGSDHSRASTISALSVLAKAAIWGFLAILLLDNFGVNVSALVAGFGISGIAIALAVQSILGDLLASLSIVLDKPFVIGDTINVGTDSGTVEHIGLKTTRLKSSTGEQLIFSNSEILKSRIRNFKRMNDRRIEFVLSITYETPIGKVESLVDLVKEEVKKVPGIRFERCFLSNFGESSLDFKVSYIVMSPEMEDYATCHHALSLGLLQSFDANGINFAYPTRTILEKST